MTTTITTTTATTTATITTDLQAVPGRTTGWSHRGGCGRQEGRWGGR